MSYIGLYILLTAISFIFIHSIGLSLPGMLIVFLSLTYAIIFFHAVNYHKIRTTYQNLINKKGLLLYFSILAFLTWIGSFLIPIRFSAGLLIFTFMNTTAIFGALYLFMQEKSLGKCCKFILLTLNLLVFYAYSAKYYPHASYPIMIIATFVTGASGFFSTKTSAIFIKHHFTASQVLAFRFWLLWIFSLIWVCVSHDFNYLSWKVIFETMGISVLSLIAPLYFFQKAVADIGPEKTSLFCALTPLVTFFLEKLFKQNNFGYLGYFSVSLAAILIGYYAISHALSRKN